MASGEAALGRLVDPASDVSAHYLLWEDGRIDQLVAEADRAWHAGRSSWAGESDLNTVSVGIEIVNGGHAYGLPPYPAAQIEALVALCGDICGRRAIPPDRVLGHSDIAPHRKDDPGERFPWPALMGVGLALRPPSLAERSPLEDWGAVQRALVAIGYECRVSGEDDAQTRAVIRAFQRRWRPTRPDGEADGETRRLIQSVRFRR